METRTDTGTIDGISPLTIAKNLSQLRENQDTLEEEIEQFRQRVLEIEGLDSKQDRSFLLRFLRARKFDQERALTLLKDYYKTRSKYREVFRITRPSLLKHCFEDNFQGMLDARDRLGRRVIIFRIENWDPSKCSVDELTACLMMYLETCINEDTTQICGISGIIDCKGLTFKHCRQFSIPLLRKVAVITQKSFPARFKAMHIVNENSFCRICISIGKTILGKKQGDRVYTHGNNFSTLHEHIDASILPSEFGGELPPLDSMLPYKIFMKSEEYFVNAYAYGYKSAETK